MPEHDNAPRLRSLAVWLLVTAVVGGLLRLLLPLPIPSADGFDELLVQVCSWALVACGVWFWLVTTVVVAAALRSGSAAARVRGVPAPVRRMILLACGAALTTGVAAPALATPGPGSADPVDYSSRVVVTDLPYPDRATDEPPPAPRQPSGAAYVVRAGDSLWDIAASRLPQDADEATIAQAWHRIYALNRDVVGPDPDTLQPGQRLELPRSLG